MLLKAKMKLAVTGFYSLENPFPARRDKPMPGESRAVIGIVD